MAVLVEAISVIVKASSIHGKYPGGWAAYANGCPNNTLAADGEIIRIGFVDPRHVRELVGRLKQAGLVLAGDSKESDFCVVDQQNGPTTACDWIDVGTVPLDIDATKNVVAARLKGSQLKTLMKPNDWKFEGSISEKPRFIDAVKVLERLEYLRTDGDVDVFWDPLEKRELFRPKAR